MQEQMNDVGLETSKDLTSIEDQIALFQQSQEKMWRVVSYIGSDLQELAEKGASFEDKNKPKVFASPNIESIEETPAMLTMETTTTA